MHNCSIIRRAAIGIATLALVAVAMFAPMPAMAGGNTIRTVNDTTNRIWITIYDLGKTQHLDYGWVAANSTRDWTAGNYHGLGYYHVRAEVKDPNDHRDNPTTIFDTSIQVNPNCPQDERPVQTVRLVENPENHRYYWIDDGCKKR